MHKVATFCRSKPEWFVLAVIVLLGGWLRFQRLDLMEFKGDERTLHRLAVQQADGHWQLAGLVSSTGLKNPPMAVYLYAIPALISGDPVALAMLPALLGTLAIALTYLLARQFLSRPVALAAALLFAVSPWAVIESRKIWAQDLLPFITILFFLFALVWLREGRWRHALAMAVALSVLNQIHYSSVALWPILLFLLWRRWSKRSAMQLLAGAALYAVLWAPFAVVVMRHEAFAAGQYNTPEMRAVQTPVHWAQAMGWQARLMGHGGFETAQGNQSPEFLDAVPARPWITWLFLILVIGGLIAATLRARKKPEFWLLLLWFLLPTVFLSIHRVMFHYFIICYPVTFLLAALFCETLWQWTRGRAGVAARALVAVFVLGLVAVAWEEVSTTRSFLNFVSANSGTVGDYGICYRDKLRVAAWMDEQAPDGRYGMFNYPDLTGDREDYRYLAGWLRGRRTSPAAARYPKPPLFVVLGPHYEDESPGRRELHGLLFEHRETKPAGALIVERFEQVGRITAPRDLLQ